MGNRSEDSEEYNGTEMDDAYWTSHETPDDSDYEWDGSQHDTSKDNTWDPGATLGDVRPEDETKAERKAREKKQRRKSWADAMREAEIEAEQKKLKREELARRAKEQREERAFQARAEAHRRGYKIEDWEVEREVMDSPAAKKERKVAAVLVAVGLVAGGIGGVIGHAVAPDAEVRVEKDIRYIDNTPSLETLANNRANEIINERGLGEADPERLRNCTLATERGIEVRNYLLASAPKSEEVAGYISTLYEAATSPDIPLEKVNEARLGLEHLSTNTFGMTERSQRMIRDFEYYAEECGVHTDSEFSNPPGDGPDLTYITEGN